MTTLIDRIREALPGSTEGPWRAGKSDFYPGLDGPLTTRVYTEIPCEEIDVSGSNCRTNARLIALAPEMAAKLLAADEVVQAIYDLAEWQSYDSARAVFAPPMPEKYECTDDAKSAMKAALEAYEAI